MLSAEKLGIFLQILMKENAHLRSLAPRDQPLPESQTIPEEVLALIMQLEQVNKEHVETLKVHCIYC